MMRLSVTAVFMSQIHQIIKSDMQIMSKSASNRNFEKYVYSTIEKLNRRANLFVMRFASEVGLCHNWVIELYITDFTSRNALVWKQLVSYLRLLAIRLWPSFLQKNNSTKHKLIYFRLIGICHFLGLLALSTSWLRMNDNHSCVHIISQVVTVTWTRKWLSDSANPSTSM